MIAVIAVTAVNFVNVIMRYIFKSGLAYCENLSLTLFMLLILIGGNIAVKSDSEIRIDVCRFKDVRKKNAFKLISDICSIIGFGMSDYLVLSHWFSTQHSTISR